LQVLANVLWGLARLAEHPGEEIMQMCLVSQQRFAAEDFKNVSELEQTVSNVLWAMAVLGEMQPAFAEKVGAQLHS
jgi:hypothetical protein